MVDQPLDLRGTLSLLGRRRLVLAGAAAVGVTCGVVLSLLGVTGAATYSSTSQVLLPPVREETPGAQRDAATEVSIAESDVVLGAAGRELGLATSLRTLDRMVHVTALSEDVLEITARAESKGLAQALAQAVAVAEVAYVQQADSSLSSAQRSVLEDRQRDLEQSLATVSDEIAVTRERIAARGTTSAAGRTDTAALAQLTAEQANLVLRIDEVKNEELSARTGRGAASIIQSAELGRRPGVVRRFGLSALLGLLAGLLLASCAVVVLAKRDRRLRTRDEIADALGSPVIGSMRSRPARTPAAWTELLADYDPGAVDGWNLRQALRQLQAMEGADAPDVDVSPIPHPSSLTVMTLAGDARALAMGPQLAAYTARAGVPTRLTTVGRHESAAALWAAFGACGAGEIAPHLWVDTGRDVEPEVSFTVVMVVVDVQAPGLADLPDTAVDLVAVAAGAPAAEELARVAVLADDARHRLDAVLVADPDPLDRTTGRLLRRERARQVPLPARATGTSAPGIGTVSTLRRKQP